MNSVREQIESRLRRSLHPKQFMLVNESHKHSVPAGSETHWNLAIVSRHFEGMNSVQRHRAVYGAVGPQLQSQIHALAIRALTPQEWASADTTHHDSPPCLGGSKAERG